MKRAKLQKYLGKRIIYSGVVGKYEKNNTTILHDVKHKNKFMCEHIWVNSKVCKKAGVGDRIEILAVATTYVDAFGVRGIGFKRQERVWDSSEKYALDLAYKEKQEINKRRAKRK